MRSSVQIKVKAQRLVREGLKILKEFSRQVIRFGIRGVV